MFIFVNDPTQSVSVGHFCCVLKIPPTDQLNSKEFSFTALYKQMEYQVMQWSIDNQ